MARPITETLHRLDGGCLMDELAEKMSELVLACDTTGKPGYLTLKINLRRATAGALAITGAVAIKKPAEAPVEALMFPTPEGNLLTEDPRQQKLSLKSVDQTTGEIKSLSA